MTTPHHTTALAVLRPPHRSGQYSSSHIREMVRTLEAHQGAHAAGMAEFFETANDLKGDRDRAEAWADVASRIRLRERLRHLDGATEAE